MSTGEIVFNAEGKAGLLTGPNHEGADTVVWLGVPEVLASEVDEATGDGTPAFSTTAPPPAQANPTA